MSVATSEAWAVSDKVSISIRSELVALSEAVTAQLSWTYVAAVYLGVTTSHRVAVADGTEISARVVSGFGPNPVPGARVHLS